MVRLVLPRVVLGNRGDIASRWGIITALHRLGIEDVSIFCDSPSNLPPLPYSTYPYGELRNLIFTRSGRKALKASETVLWAGGLDLQDDSSLMKLIYIWVIFRIFRSMGLNIWCFLQGVGPLNTSMGRGIARGILKQVNRFVTRDPASMKLLQEIHPEGDYSCGQDGIFMPGLEDSKLDRSSNVDPIFSDNPELVIGFNIRMWFHFNSSFLPYEFSQRAFQERSKEQMRKLVTASCEAITRLREDCDARVVLLSGYQPEVVPWEDDLPWLAQIKEVFQTDPEVILFDAPVSMPEYYTLMSSLDLVIAMRLHTTLTALRFGVPAINLSYTLKGSGILSDLGLGDYALLLEDFMCSPESVMDKASGILSDMAGNQERVKSVVAAAIEKNEVVLKRTFRSLTENASHSSRGQSG